MADITMPQLGETVTEGTITRWAKQVGERVEVDEVLFEVSTDKVDSEVPSPVAGFVTEILVPEGETVDVGARLAVVGDSPAQTGNGSAAPAPATAAPEPARAAPEPAPEQPPAETVAPEVKTDSAPVSSDRPVSAPMDETTPQEPQAAPAAPPAPSQEGQGQLLSPVVRRLLAENGLEVSDIPASGSGGRITRNDVLDFIDRQRSGKAARPQPQAQPQPQPQPQAGAASAPAAPRPTPGAPAPVAASRVAPFEPVTAGSDDEVIPFTNIRRRTAEHMIRSRATSAHTLTAVEVDFSAVDAARRAAQEQFRAAEGFGLTYLPFVARAVVDALAAFPRLNASVGDESLIVHKRVHLGVAVDLDLEGLMVPVVHDADSARLRAIARAVRDLAERARTRRLGPDELAGGTFTITNPGPFSTFMTIPIINQPQVAVLSTDGVRKRPVAVTLPDGSDAVAVHPVGMLALSFDHRAVDGAYASAFLARVREILESRDWSQEL
ncbi:MAG TPA: dihydrolipoamide acetyltransferase family protein [Acidimicrobiales bacterium]|nr:dihydrolipoamide acetyltransferase family protein [Acidimicrobiales bacterium]